MNHLHSFPLALRQLHVIRVVIGSLELVLRQPWYTIGSKTRATFSTNRDSFALIFPRCASATCNYFELWLVHWNWFCDNHGTRLAQKLAPHFQPIATHSHSFSRALRQLHVITSSVNWFTGLPVSFVIILSKGSKPFIWDLTRAAKWPQLKAALYYRTLPNNFLWQNITLKVIP